MAVYLAQFVALDAATGTSWSGAALVPAASAADAEREALAAAHVHLPPDRFYKHSTRWEPLAANWVYERADGKRYRMVTVAVELEENAVVPARENDDAAL